MSRVTALALVVLAWSATARAQGDEVRRLREVAETAIARGQHYPVVELMTMGIGSLIWERHGHIALCIVYENPQADACYNYGVANFQHPVQMALGFVRGTHSFWVGKTDPADMLSVYLRFDRTVWVQPLPLDERQTRKVIDKLEHDILVENRYYAYDHFWDNCATRVRNVIDDATDHALSAMPDPEGANTYRDLAREGFYGVADYVPLLITDLAMGPVADRVPSYYNRMFLPDFLREAVAKKWGVQPVSIYVRKECRGSSVAGCAERGAPYQDPASGRLWFVLISLMLTAPAWATRLWGRFQRTGMAISVIPYALLGLVFWFLAIISPLSYLRWNASCLVLFPADLLLVWWLSPERRRTYARVRVAMLIVIAAVLAVGVLRQPLSYALVWPLVPTAVAAFWRNPE
jgi:hypothetical protein